MKKYVLFFLIISLLTACKEKKANQLTINDPNRTTQSLNKSGQKLEIDGYYLPLNRFLIGKYKMESLLVNSDKQKLLVEMNLVDTLSGVALLKTIDESTLKGDTLLIHMNDDALGKLSFKGIFLMSPVNNPKVKEKSTIVMKGKVSINNLLFDVEFMYFGGD